MTRGRCRSAGLLAGPALLSLLVTAPASPQEPFRFRARVQTVLLNVSVKDASGLPVRGLPQGAFTVTDEGEERPLVFFDETSEPLSVALVLDVSSSMLGDRLDEAKRAAKTFLQDAGASEIALIAFDDKVRVEVPWTDRLEDVHAAIDGLTARGGTALYQGIASGLHLLKEAAHRRTALVVLSDGKEEDSEIAFSDLHRLVEVSEAPVYAIGFYTHDERKRYEPGKKYYKEPEFDVNLNPAWVLGELAGSSGGIALYPARGEELTPAFRSLASELRHQYLLGFEPALAGTEAEGFRRVEVLVGSPGHDQPLQVRTRSGYRPSTPSSE